MIGESLLDNTQGKLKHEERITLLIMCPFTLEGNVASTASAGAQTYHTPQARQQASGSGGVAQTSTALPTFNPIVEFFKVLAKSYQGVRVDKLKSLKDFQRKIGESL